MSRRSGEPGRTTHPAHSAHAAYAARAGAVPSPAPHHQRPAPLYPPPCHTPPPLERPRPLKCSPSIRPPRLTRHAPFGPIGNALSRPPSLLRRCPLLLEGLCTSRRSASRCCTAGHRKSAIVNTNSNGVFFADALGDLRGRRGRIERKLGRLPSLIDIEEAMSEVFFAFVFTGDHQQRGRTRR